MWRAAAFPVCAFLCTQVLAAAWMLLFAFKNDSSYFDFVSRWDGAYYLEIARNGYTADILRGGELANPNWAFYPLYPLAVGLLARLSTLDPSIVAPLLSLGCGTGAVALLHQAVSVRLGLRAARVTTVVVSTAVAAPVLQMAYAESMSFLLLVAALEATIRRRYGWMLALAPLLALCRPVALPFAAVVAVHVLSTRSAHAKSRGRGLLVVVSAVCMAALWPIIAGVATGVPDLYLRTMALWEVPGVGRNWFTQSAGQPIGWVLIAAALTLPLWVAARFLPPGVPLEWRAWMVAYPAYLLFASYPSSSTVRYLLLAFPFALAFARADIPRWVPWIVSGLGLAGGFFWVRHFVASWIDIFP